MNQTIIIAPDGTITVKDWPKDRPTLKWLQTAVGGWIEAVPHWTTWCENGTPAASQRPCIVFCNEEGKLKDLPLNTYATQRWMRALGVETIGDALCGTIVAVIGDAKFRHEADEEDEA